MQAKNGAGSATLSMAYAGFRWVLYSCYACCKISAKTVQRFAEKLIKASKGEKGIVEPTFVYLRGVPGGEEIAKETGVDYFSVPVELGVSSAISTYALHIANSKIAFWCGEGH